MYVIIPLMSDDMNPIQIGIIRQLALHSPLHFAKLNVDGVPSDQFSYHLRQLQKYGLVAKNETGEYRLTTIGKSRRVVMSRNMQSFVTQGFIALRIVICKQDAGEEHILVQERLTEPYRGSLSTPGNKVAYGEDVQVAAERIMYEQTGLRGKLSCRGLVHYKDEFQGAVVQDKFFFIFRATDIRGELREDLETDKNMWMTPRALLNSPHSIHGNDEILAISQSEQMIFTERTFALTDY